MQLGVARILGQLGVLDEVRETTRFANRIDAIRAAIREA
jgi:hypothetical protein